MRLSRRKLLAGVVAIVAASAVPASWLFTRRDEPSPERRPEPAAPEHVILVDWDGLDPDYLARAPTPNLDALAARGSLSVARSTFPTLSNPSRASMSTGAYPETHGNAAYYLNGETGEAVGANRFLAAETIAEALSAEGKTTASVQWYMVQGHGASYGDHERLYVEPGGPFERRVDAAIEILNRRPVDSGGRQVIVPKIPDFLAVYGSDLDDLGHREGAESPNIGPLLAELDRQLGRLVRATEDIGIHERTAWILTSDHGMTSWDRSLAEEFTAIAAVGYRLGIALPSRPASPDAEIVVVPSAVRIADVTLHGRAATPEGRAQVRAALQSAPHVARVLDEQDLEALRAGDKPGDLVVEAEEPWGFGLPEPEEGTSRGSHGSLKEIEVPLLLAGAGVRGGVPPHNPGLVDIAPTIAALLGTRPPAQAQGRALVESLGR